MLLNHTLFTSGLKDVSIVELNRIRLANLFLLSSTIVMFLVLIHRVIVDPIPSLLLLNTFACFGFFMAYMWLRHTKDLNLIVKILVVFVIITQLILIKINANASFGLAWTFIVPLFLIPLIGTKKSILSLGLFYAFIFGFMFFDSDLWAKNGWNNESLTRYIAVSSGIIILGSFYNLIFEKFQSDLYELSITDGLTNVFNRRKIDEVLDNELQRATRNKNDLSLCMLDIDDFKKINDSFGHLVGDKVLKNMGKILKENSRNVDIVGRWGGEEFCIIMPNTNMQEAKVLTQRIQESIKNHDFELKQPLTCSFGLANTNGSCTLRDDFVKKADDALYQAKNNGKNKIVLAV